MFTVKNILFEEQFLSIKFSSEKRFETLTSEIRLKDMTRYAVGSYTQFTEIKVTGRPDEYELRLPYSLFTEQFVLKSLSRQVVWIYIHNGEDYYELKVDQKLKEKIKSIEPIKISKIAQIKPMNKGKHALALDITKVTNAIELRDIDVNKDHILLNIKENGSTHINQLYLKKRAFKDTLIYSDSIKLNRVDVHKYKLAYRDLLNINLDTVNNMDFIAEIADKNITTESPILSTVELKNTNLDIYDYLQSKLYLTPKKGLALRIEKQYSAVEILSVSKEKIQIDLSHVDIQSEERIKCGLFRVSKVLNDDELILYKEIGSKIDDRILSVNFNADKLFSDIEVVSEQSYRIMVYRDNEIKQVKFRLACPEQTQLTFEYPKTTVKCTFEDEARVSVKPKAKASVNISILGSCYSRAAFNSSNAYFNPDYKRFYNIVYSHFWISLVSAISEKIPFDKKLFTDVPEKEMVKVIREYDKTTFDELKASNTDYVIIDLFVDAVHGCRRFPDGRYIGQNPDMHKSSYFKNQLLKDTEQFDNRNPEFWEVWQSACDAFITKLLEIVDQDKIILNWGSLTDEYINEKEQVSSFSKEKKFNKTDIKFINHTWNRMNNYFMAKAPSAKAIDLRKFHYKASLEYPYGGGGPHHYEKNYYKSFLGELSKLVLEDKITQ